jgi:hypothetical protein
VFTSGDLDQFYMKGGRGGNQGSDFYDLFAEIETNAKLLSVERCSLKSADFTATNRAQYTDEQYYLITQTVRDDNAGLARSQQSFAVWICDGGALDSNPMELGLTLKGTK